MSATWWLDMAAFWRHRAKTDPTARERAASLARCRAAILNARAANLDGI